MNPCVCRCSRLLRRVPGSSDNWHCNPHCAVSRQTSTSFAYVCRQMLDTCRTISAHRKGFLTGPVAESRSDQMIRARPGSMPRLDSGFAGRADRSLCRNLTHHHRSRTRFLWCIFVSPRRYRYRPCLTNTKATKAASEHPDVECTPCRFTNRFPIEIRSRHCGERSDEVISIHGCHGQKIATTLVAPQ